MGLSLHLAQIVKTQPRDHVCDLCSALSFSSLLPHCCIILELPHKQLCSISLSVCCRRKTFGSLDLGQVGGRWQATRLPSMAIHHRILPWQRHCLRLMRTALCQKNRLGPGGHFPPGLLSADCPPWMQLHRRRRRRRKRSPSRKGMSSLEAHALCAGRVVSALTLPVMSFWCGHTASLAHRDKFKFLGCPDTWNHERV